MRKALGLLCMMACLCTVPGAYARDTPNIVTASIFAFRNLHQDTTNVKAPNIDAQISPFVRRIFQDKSENLWFGTNGDGVIRYDGDSLEYFSINEGFGGARFAPAPRGEIGPRAL